MEVEGSHTIAPEPKLVYVVAGFAKQTKKNPLIYIRYRYIERDRDRDRSEINVAFKRNLEWSYISRYYDNLLSKHF